MEQIKNYLSQIQNMDKVIVLSSTSEFEGLKEWILNNNVAFEVYEHPDEINTFEHVGAIIFDYKKNDFLLYKVNLSCDFLIGRMKEDEDSFRLWEKYREKSKEIYIDRNKGLESFEVTPDRSNNEILHWKKGKSDIELSVIIPVYNVAEFLPRCIESLTKWKVPYVEYLFINDGSSDDSEIIIEKYALKDKRIRLIGKENGGCASARNRGLKEARGRYVGFVDSDDFVDEHMLYKLFSRVLIGGYDISYCGYNEYEEESGRSTPVKNDCLNDFYREGTWRQDKVQLLAVKTRVAIWRCLYKKELLQQNRILFHEELKRFDDLPFRVEVLFTAKSAVCVPEHLYYYCLGRTGQDVSCRDDKLYVHFQIFDILDQFVDSLQDSRLKDLLQIIKIHTHGFGLSRIEKKYKKDYAQKAVKQLDRNMGYLRTILLILMHTGKGNLRWYTWIKVNKSYLKFMK